MSKDVFEVAKHKAEMLDSYIYAILECGGSPSKFIADIETMTVKDMIDILAQNGVRFTTVKLQRSKAREDYEREVRRKHRESACIL